MYCPIIGKFTPVAFVITSIRLQPTGGQLASGEALTLTIQCCLAHAETKDQQIYPSVGP